MTPKEEDEERLVLPIEKLDRLNPKNFRRYIVENPHYAREVFGYVPTDEQLNKFIENHSELFYDYKPKRRKVYEGY